MTETIEALIMRYRREADALRTSGYVVAADARAVTAVEIYNASAEWRATLGLSEAMLYTGASERWLRAEWRRLNAQSENLAWKQGRTLVFRRVALRRRADVAGARAMGEAAAA